MKTSVNGLTLIETSEGLRLQAYEDVVGVWTIGYGHKIVPGDGYSPVSVITQEQAQARLALDVATAERSVNTHAPQANQNQFDALVDFTFNLGIGALQTMLSHGWDQVPQQIPRWNQAGGKVLEALVNRRAAEVTLFETPVSA